MKELFKWQFISLISRGMAMFIGLVQSFVILRILTQGDWGLVQLALSIGGALGIYQHLGLASASTREIAASKDDTKIFKIFLTSVAIRYIITLPLSIGLFILAPKIASEVYHSARLTIPLQIYAVTILFQGFQSILNSVISGTKRFKELFTYQVVIAFIGMFMYLPLVYFYGVAGYFYAFLLFNIVATLLLSFIAFKPLRGKLLLPSKHDFMVLFKEIFSISLVIYVVKIIYTNWEKLGPNVLGMTLSPEKIAIYSFALMFAKKIMSISDAITDVNLPVLSEKFINNIEDFQKTFTQNFDKVFSFVIISSSVAAYWAPEIIKFAVGSEKYIEYYDSLVLILPLLTAFIIYSLINIVKSSILIPAKMIKPMLLSFVFLILFTILPFGVFYYGKTMDVLLAMSLSMAIGSIVSYYYICISIKNKLNFSHFNKSHLLIIIQFLSIGYASTIDILWMKVGLFIYLFILLISGVMVAEFLTKKEVHQIRDKFFRMIKLIK